MQRKRDILYKKLLTSMNVKSRAGSRVETTTITMGRNDELIGQALGKIHNIQNIGENVKAHKDLDEVNKQLSTAVNYLNAIKQIGGLQAHEFGTEIKAAIAVLRECESLFAKLPDNSTISSQISVEQMGGEKQLKPMQGQLDKMLQQISLRVLETPVGVKGGVLVELSVLNETNAEVEPIFKKNLVLVDFLKKEGIIDGKALNGTISFEPAKFEAFKNPVSQASKSQAPTSQNVRAEFTRAIIQDNIAGDGMKTFTGNIDVGSGYTASYMGTSTFRGNRIGNDGALFTGDIGGPAAVAMMQGLFGKPATTGPATAGPATTESATT